MSAQPIRSRAVYLLFAASFLAPPAARAATYTDNFNRTGFPTTWTLNSTNWIEKENLADSCDMALHILNDTKVRTAQCSGGFAAWNATFAATQYSKLKYLNDDDVLQDIGGPAVRINSAGTWDNATLYMAEYDRANGKVRVLKYVNERLNTGGTQLGADYTITLAAGDILELHASGSTLTVKKSGTTLFSVTDSSITSGKAGIAVRTTGASGAIAWDDWEGGDTPTVLVNQDTWNSSTGQWEGNPHAPSFDTPPPTPTPCQQASTAEWFGPRITRMTNATGDGVNHHGSIYATQAWYNANGTKLLVLNGNSGGTLALLDRATCTTSTSGVSGVGYSEDPAWHRTDSNVLFYLDEQISPANTWILQRRDVSATPPTDDLIDTFSGYTNITRPEGDLSQDGCRLAYLGTKTDGTKEVFIYTLTAAQGGTGCPGGGKTTVFTFSSPTSVDWVHISTPHQDRPTDKGHVVVAFTNYQGAPATRVYDFENDSTPTFGAGVTLASFIGHEDVGFDASGQQVLVMFNANQSSPPSDCVYSIMKWTLPNTSPACLKKGNPAFPATLLWHIALPGVKSDWVYLSFYDGGGASYTSDKFRREIVRVRLDGSGYNQSAAVRPWDRLAHTHTHSTSDDFTQPRVSISHDGTKLFWGANFAEPTSGSYPMDGYELTVP